MDGEEVKVRGYWTAVVLLSYCGCLAVEGYSVTTLSYHHSMLHQQRWAVMFYCNLITFFK